MTIFKENFEKIFSRISTSALGFNHAKQHPDRAVYEALLPVLNYHISSQNKNTIWNNYLCSLKNAKGLSDIKVPDTFRESQLNKIFHIEDSELQIPFDTRGCVIEINKFIKSTLVSFNIEDADEWISKLIAIRNSGPHQEKRKNEILQNCKLIAIEISAACDYSNKKQRINKYILGVITSNLNSNLDKDLNLKSRPESCYHLGGCSFYYQGKDCHIWLNLNYVFGAKSNDSRLGRKLFVFKKEIMDMLGNKYASHVSRIGITSF